MEYLTSLPMEHLKFLFKFYKEYKKNYLQINRNHINKNININTLEGERFEPHPYIPVSASNYGRIMYLNKIMDQNIFKDCMYVNVQFEIKKLIDEIEKNIIQNNKMSTPIINEISEYEIDEKFEYIDKIWHPCIQIGKYNSKIINLYEYKDKNKKRKNENYGKVFKEKEENGIRYIEIPIYVYRLVAETWLENPNYKIYNTVHHITNNGYDNSIYNLIWVNDIQHDEIEK